MAIPGPGGPARSLLLHLVPVLQVTLVAPAIPGAETKAWPGLPTAGCFFLRLRVEKATLSCASRDNANRSQPGDSAIPRVDHSHMGPCHPFAPRPDVASVQRPPDTEEDRSGPSAAGGVSAAPEPGQACRERGTSSSCSVEPSPVRSTHLETPQPGSAPAPWPCPPRVKAITCSCPTPLPELWRLMSPTQEPWPLCPPPRSAPCVPYLGAPALAPPSAPAGPS